MTEWIGSRYQLEGGVREGDAVIRPDVVMWLELPRNVIVGTKIVLPEERGSFAEALEEAMRRPLEGAPRRPARIRVPDESMARELRDTASGIPVTVAPVPELDFLFMQLGNSMTEAEEQREPSYLGDGDVATEVIADFFDVAALLFRAEPWEIIFESQLIRVDIPAMDVDDAYLSVIGAAGQSAGILLFRSMEDYDAFSRAGEEGPDPNAPHGTISVRSLSFDRKKAMPAGMLREIKKHGWPVAARDAYPTLLCLDQTMTRIVETERDYRIMTACARALLAFFARYGHLFEEEVEEPVHDSFTEGDGPAVTLTGPINTIRIVSPFEDDFELPPAPPRPKVGRNDPCPCGSGKKYKKCHLDLD